ncbi:MAG: hypothetical protein QOH19_1260 [Actinomycetota bacterium]|nr:hypothetical protein [Actinomycetota bacterium]
MRTGASDSPTRSRWIWDPFHAQADEDRRIFPGGRAGANRSYLPSISTFPVIDSPASGLLPQRTARRRARPYRTVTGHLRMSCATALPLAAHPADSIIARLGKRAPARFRPATCSGASAWDATQGSFRPCMPTTSRAASSCGAADGATAPRIRHRLLPQLDINVDRAVLLAGVNDPVPANAQRVGRRSHRHHRRPLRPRCPCHGCPDPALPGISVLTLSPMGLAALPGRRN